MKKIITYETIRSFAYVNDKVCKKPIKGIVIYFCGLNNKDIYDDDTNEGVYYGEEGVLYVHPYNNPWSWMNAQAIAYTDEIVDVLFEKYGLPEDTPVVSMGQSMGGLASLVYTKYAKRTPVACIPNCPVCDLVYHFTERPDLPRTIYSAFWNEEGELNDILKRYSPFHLAPEMPKVKCLIECRDSKNERHRATIRWIVVTASDQGAQFAPRPNPIISRFRWNCNRIIIWAHSSAG